MTGNGSQFFETEESGTQNSFEVFLHAFDGTLPKTPKMGRPRRAVMPCDPVVSEEVVLDFFFCFLLPQKLVEIVQVVFWPQ